jgi:tRNA(Ile)-lysidine synthase
MTIIPPIARSSDPLRLLAELRKSWPPEAWGDVSVVVAVSGGPDSVALLRAMAVLKSASPDAPGRLFVAHVHHGLRGEAADSDQQSVEALAARLNLPSTSKRVDVRALARRDGDGLEAAARKLRYRALRDIAHEVGARYVAIAHTADDQIETILHRLVRGTGMAGLAGIPRARRLSPAVTLIRPLLGVRRATVMAYLEALDQTYCVDATNADRDLTRARIRHDLLPGLLRDYNPQADQAILRLGRLAGEANDVVGRLVRDLTRRAARRVDAHTVRLVRSALADEPRYLVCEMLADVWRKQKWPRQAMSFGHWRRLAELAQSADDAPLTLPGNILARAQGDALLLTNRLAPHARVKR